MKKIYTLIGSLAIAFAANAQTVTRSTSDLQMVSQPQITGQQIANSVATATTTILLPASFKNTGCQSTDIGFYSFTGYGYVAGTNTAGDNMKAQRYSLMTYSLATPATVMGVQAVMTSVGTGSITAKIYGDNAGAPGTLLGTSLPCNITTIMTNSNTAVFTFATPVALTGPFFYVAVDFDALDAAGTGTVAIASTNTCTANGSGAWENWVNDDGLWYSFADANNWGSNLDLGIFPVLSAEISTGIKSNSTTSISLFPNPTSGVLNINSVEVTSSFEVFNLIGSKVFSSTLTKGNNNVDLSGLANGSYFVKLNSDNQVISKKIIISK